MCACALAACNSGGSGGAPPGSPPPSTAKYDATVRITSFGIPHVLAQDYGSLGFGIGYMEAKDNLCVIAEDLVSIRGERSKFFGSDGSYTIFPTLVTTDNIDSDFFWKFVATKERIDALKQAAIPEAVAATQGFADGYNRFVRELRAGQHPGLDAACADQPWIGPITVDDMYRRYFRLLILASDSVFPTEIATAAPPAPGTNPASASNAEILAKIKPQDLPFAHPLKIGSNMYGLGPDATQNGQAMLFGNPHFPWRGPERLYQMQLTIPGTVDIFGSALYGVPAVLIGFNSHFAWSHTVSTAFRFTFFELTLDPSDPTRYLVDGQSVPMEKVPVTIDVKQADGTLQPMTRTLYRSQFGPMLVLSASGVPVLPWTTSKAYTLRDANAENTRVVNQFFEWNRAKSLDEFEALHARILGIPWVNTIAAGPGQPVYYGDLSVVPNVPDAKVQACQSSVSPAFAQLVPGLPVLDGSQSSCNWDSDPDAPAPSIFGPSHLPKLIRNDYVDNNNDSYWLTNPQEPLTGFARIIGDENTARSLRTRLALLQIQRRIAGTDGLPDTKFTLDNLEQIVLDSRVYTGELARDAVEANICPQGTVLGSNGPVDITQACQVLADWDLAANLDSVGAPLWREFWFRARSATGLWQTPFSSADPVNTPRDLNTFSPQVQQALGDAVQQLNDFGIPLDEPLGQLQHSGIDDGKVIPVFGDLGDITGSFTVVLATADSNGLTTTGLTKGGYAIDFGNSYIQAVTWDSDGNPIAQGFVTYSQSTDPASPHFDDQTQRYSNKEWITYPFTEQQIAADPDLQVIELKE